uniref:Uncharacterized protein n=1 Tax=Plectus sambesii TaxID=2011161 RepID=A0A914UIY2_9BILA
MPDQKDSKAKKDLASGGANKPAKGQMDLKKILQSNEMQKFISEMNNHGPVRDSSKMKPGVIIGPGSGAMLRK